MKKKENKQRLKNIKKIIVKEKHQHKKFWSFFFAWYKLEQEALVFGGQYIDKKSFHKIEKTINIDKVETKRIVLTKKDWYAIKSFI